MITTLRQVRARTVSVEFLDDALLSIQESGGTISQVFPYNNGLKGESIDVGRGVGSQEFAITASFAILYTEDNPDYPKSMPMSAERP